MITRTIPFDPRGLDMGEIYRGLGYGAAEPPQDVKDMVDEMIARIAEVCRPAYGYLVAASVGVERIGITANGTRFITGSIIAECLQQAEQLVIFVATAGVEYDRWLRDVHRTGDVWNMFLADAIGSEVAEAAARAAADDIKSLAAGRGMWASNSYSPGYCGWSVKEQQKLFAMLEPAPCGITLTESSLMVPIKSISGFIALGAKVEKMPYGCEICNRADCYKKIAQANARTNAK